MSRIGLGPLGWVGAAIVAMIAVVSLAAPLLAPHDPLSVDVSAILQGPSGAHPLGTDEAGRDVLSRVVHGGRIALLVALAAVLLATAIGVALGVAAGMTKGVADSVLSRVAEVHLALPAIVLTLVVLAFLGSGPVTLVLVLAATAWPLPFRLVRAHVLSTTAKPFVEAARVSGASPLDVARRHLLPSVLPLAIVAATLSFSYVLLLEASLSFLGLGVQPPTPDWGQMVQTGQAQLGGAWWIATSPGVALLVLLLGVQLLGDALAERLSVDGLLRSARA